MGKSPFPALIVACCVLAIAWGCSLKSNPQSRFEATGLTYVAAERAKDRPGGEPGPAENPDLEGFVEELEIRDGQVAMSLEQVIRRTLKSSLEIQVASYTPAIAETDVMAAESAFDPMFFLEGSIQKVDRPNVAFLNLVGNRFTKEDTRLVSTGISKTFATGGSLTLSENVEYFRTNSPLMQSPTYTTDFMIELAQPILRGMGFDANKAQIYIASHNRDASLESFLRDVQDVLVDVEATYWELVFAVRDVEVRKRSLALAEEVYRKEQSRAEQQMARPLEVSRARAAVTSRNAELIRAQNRVRDLSDALKNAMNDPELQLMSDVLVVPSDDPGVSQVAIERNKAVITALAMRPELQELREQIKAIEAQQRFDRNQLLPRLDVSFAFKQNSVAQRSRQAFRDQGTHRFGDYTTGLVFEVPIGNRLAEANYRRSKLELQQAQCSLDDLTQQVILEVNTAIREVETNLKEIEATREARIAAKDTLDGEQARYDVGDVTNEELLRAQRDLEEAERNELQAVTRLNVAIIAVERAKGSLLEYNNVHVLPKDYNELTR